MRRTVGMLAALVASLVVTQHVPARAEDPGIPVPLVATPVAPGVASPNIRYMGTIPLDDPGVGARVLEHKGHRRLYVTGVPGLTIYDIDDPAEPKILGHTQLPSWENEDVSVSRDGGTTLVSEFLGTYLYVVDTSNVLVPRVVGFLPTGAGHTVECMDDPCNWVYGSGGSIIDLRVKSNPILRTEKWTRLLGLPGGHNVTHDAAGVTWIDTKPIAAVDTRNPLRPRLIAAGGADSPQPGTQHNVLRPNAQRYRPRLSAGQPVPTKGLRPGELLLSTGETNFTRTCGTGAGPFSTYSVAGLEHGGRSRFRLLDTFRPISGTYANGDPAVNAIGCSSHWFSVQPQGGLVAAAWYEHGTRILKVDPTNGKIGQVGFFQPVVGSASAAHWIDDEYLYVIDYERGIDILRYDAKARVPSQADFDRSWLAKRPGSDSVSNADRLLCRLAVTNQG